MSYPCPSVTTMVTLDTQQIKVLLDVMWEAPVSVMQKSAKHHGVDDNELVSQLAKCLESALSELD